MYQKWFSCLKSRKEKAERKEKHRQMRGERKKDQRRRKTVVRA